MSYLLNQETLNTESNLSLTLERLNELLKKFQNPENAEHKKFKVLKNGISFLNAVSALALTFEKLSKACDGASLNQVLDSKIILEQISGLTAAIKKLFLEAIDAEKAQLINHIILRTQETLLEFLKELHRKSPNHPLLANSAGTIKMQVLQQYTNIPAQKRILDFDSLKEKLGIFLTFAYEAYMEVEKQQKAEARKAMIQAEAVAARAQNDTQNRRKSIVKMKPKEAEEAPAVVAAPKAEPAPMLVAPKVEPAAKPKDNPSKENANADAKTIFEQRQSLQAMLDAYNDPSLLDTPQKLSKKDAMIVLGKLGLAQLATMRQLSKKRYLALPLAKRREYDRAQPQMEPSLHDWNFIDENPNALTKILQNIAQNIVPTLDIQDLAKACYHLSESYIAHDGLNAALVKRIHALLLCDPLKSIADKLDLTTYSLKPADFNLADHTEDFPELGQAEAPTKKSPSPSQQQAEHDQKMIQENMVQAYMEGEYTFSIKDMDHILGFLCQMRCDENALVSNVNKIIIDACQCTYLVIKKFLESRNNSARNKKDAFKSISNIVHNLAMLLHASPDLAFKREFIERMNPVFIAFRKLGKLEIDSRPYCFSIKDGIFWYALTKAFLNNLEALKQDWYEAALIEGRNPYGEGEIRNENENDKNKKPPTEFERDVNALLKKIFPEATIESEYLLGAHRYDFYIRNTKFKRDFTVECDGTFYHHMMRYNDTGFQDGEYLDGKSQFKRKFAQKRGICAVNVPYAPFYSAAPEQQMFLQALMVKALLGIEGPMAPVLPKALPLIAGKPEKKASLDIPAAEVPAPVHPGQMQLRLSPEFFQPNNPELQPGFNPVSVQPILNPGCVHPSQFPGFVHPNLSPGCAFRPLGINPNLRQFPIPGERSPSLQSVHSVDSLQSTDSTSPEALLGPQGSPQGSPPSSGFPSPFYSPTATPADSPTRISPLPMFFLGGVMMRPHPMGVPLQQNGVPLQQQNGVQQQHLMQQQKPVLYAQQEIEQQRMMREREQRKAEQDKMERQRKAADLKEREEALRISEQNGLKPADPPKPADSNAVKIQPKSIKQLSRHI